jgi:hypothetical protein
VKWTRRKSPYAIIGGVALQVHSPDPRTTIDIDVAVMSRDAIPRDAMGRAGFREDDSSWLFADRTLVRFTEDPALAAAIEAAGTTELDGVMLRVISAVDLLHEKIRSGSDPARRRTKQLRDLADAEALLETYPDLAPRLRADERAILERLR